MHYNVKLVNHLVQICLVTFSTLYIRVINAYIVTRKLHGSHFKNNEILQSQKNKRAQDYYRNCLYQSSTNEVNNYFESTSDYFLRRNVELPLMEFNKLEKLANCENNAVIPLPTSHLDDEVSTLNLYSYNVTNIASYTSLVNYLEGKSIPEVGILVSKGADPSDELGYIGGIGCATSLISTSRTEETTSILVKGTFRFVIKSVESTFPYITAIVDELPDLRESDVEEIFYSDFEQDTDSNLLNNDQYQQFRGIPPNELFKSCIHSIKTYMDIQNEKYQQSVNPLENFILESAGVSQTDLKASMDEKMAVWQVFISTILPEIYSPSIRYFTTCFMAAELLSADNTLRKSILQTRDASFRLKIIIQALITFNSEAQAKKMTTQISASTSLGANSTGGESSKDLKVSDNPPLPAWVRQMKKGMRLEYFWNEEEGWCVATIMNVEKIVDEYVFTLLFDGEEEKYRVPFEPLDRVRWRPVSNS